MDTDTIDVMEEAQEEELRTRPSSWSAALSQLPGFPSAGPAAMPQPVGAAREVTSAVEEDLASEEEELR